MKRALITGITGQDGFYLAELLLGKGYEGLRPGPAFEFYLATENRSSAISGERREWRSEPISLP